MINKELIELQKGCNATCVVIQNEDIKELESNILVNSTYNINELIKIFKEKISSKKYDYFVIEEIDKINSNEQDKYYQNTQYKLDFCAFLCYNNNMFEYFEEFSIENMKGNE